MAVKIEKSLEGLFRKGGSQKKDSTVLNILNRAIIDTQPNGEEIVYFSGKYIGSKIIDIHKKKGGGNSIPTLIKRTAERLGIGNVIGIEIKGNKILLEMETTPIHKNDSRKDCKLLQGMLAGMVSQASDRAYRLKSVKTKGRKRHICIFQFESVR